MTYISDLHDVPSDASDEKAKELIPDRNREAIQKEIAELVDEEFDRLESDAAYFLTQTAADRAEKFLERVLRGDDDAAMALLGNTHSDRYKTLGCDEGSPWCHLIHGSLFETGGIRLRREIVEAHPDLLRNERIADLEAVVDGLTQQVRELESDLEACRNRL